MDGQPSPVERTIAFSQSQDYDDFGAVNLGILPPYTGVRAYDTPLTQWYSNNDGPWVPEGIASAHNGRIPGHPGGARSRSNQAGFLPSYPENIVPSECDGMPASDSGYGSNINKQSVASVSVCDEPLSRLDVPAVIDGSEDVHFRNLGPRSGPPGQQVEWSEVAVQKSTNEKSKPTPTGPMVCDECNKELRTNSEFKKHRQRHAKPFRCDVQGCSRAVGFSTTNDLDRHKRSKHPTSLANGCHYVCTIGACQKKEKLWPRADNFRAHIKRVHGEALVPADEESLKKFEHSKSQTSFQTSQASLIANPTSIDLHESNFDPSLESAESLFWSPPMQDNLRKTCDLKEIHRYRLDDTQSLPDHHISLLRRPSFSYDQSETQTTIEPRLLPSNTRSSERAKLGAPNRRPLDTLSIGPGVSYGHIQDDYGAVSTAGDNSNDHGEPADDVEPLPKTVTDPVVFANLGGAVDKQLDSYESDKAAPSRRPSISTLANKLSTEEAKELIEMLQSRLKKTASPDQESKPSTASSNPPRGPRVVKCDTCDKGFGRPCDLKKHMKRHEKPYGCTYPNCNRRFGSKNDWKRHENSQHFLLEVWRCKELRGDASRELCGKVSHRRETFKQHLSSQHNIHDTVAIDKKLEDCRIGRNCEDRFWCGFCKAIIEIKEKGQRAWAERFNHIEDHYFGRNQLTKTEHKDWKNVDPDIQTIDFSDADSEEDSSASSPSEQSKPSKETAASPKTKRKAPDQPAGIKSKRVKTRCPEDPKKEPSPLRSDSLFCCKCHEFIPRTLGNACLECQHLSCTECFQES